VNGPSLRFSSLVAGALLLGGSLVARPAQAALGEKISEKETQALAIPAGPTLRVREHDGVREYVGDDGKVFAFRWRRAMAPDLDTLLGSYLPAYQAAVQKHRPMSRTVYVIRTPELVVSKLMHGHVVSGVAYLPAQLPKGVTVDALR
jgi:hypothetical protein